MEVGDKASMPSWLVTLGDVQAYTSLSGDRNPLHHDEAYARLTRFGRPVVPGLLSVGLISALLGTRLPGPGTVLSDLSLHFKAPVFVGDVITATAVYAGETPSFMASNPSAIRGRSRTVKFTVTNQDGRVVVDGDARDYVDLRGQEARDEYLEGLYLSISAADKEREEIQKRGRRESETPGGGISPSGVSPSPPRCGCDVVRLHGYHLPGCQAANPAAPHEHSPECEGLFPDPKDEHWADEQPANPAAPDTSGEASPARRGRDG